MKKNRAPRKIITVQKFNLGPNFPGNNVAWNGGNVQLWMGVGSQARSILAFGCAFDPTARLPGEELTLETFAGVGCELRNPVRTSTRCILGGANGRCAASGSSEASL